VTCSFHGCAALTSHLQATLILTGKTRLSRVGRTLIVALLGTLAHGKETVVGHEFGTSRSKRTGDERQRYDRALKLASWWFDAEGGLHRR
jgi:hypothetical protein